MTARSCRAILLWLDVTDPGAVRRRHAIRTGLAAACSWLTLRSAVALGGGSSRPTAAVLYAVVACLVGALAIADVRRRDRLDSMGRGCVVALAALMIASLIGDYVVLARCVLLVLMFTSFASRRFGPRAGQLALVATMSFYFTTSSGVDSNNLGWFVGATICGFGWLAVWQFVLVRFDPQQSLVAASRSYYRRAGDLVGDVRAHVALASGRLDGSQPDATDLSRQLGRVAATRRVMEAQLSASVPPGGRDASAIEQLQLALFSTEQGLGMMVDAVADPVWLATVDHGIIESLDQTLEALAAALSQGAPPSAIEALADRAQVLRHGVAHAVDGLDRSSAQSSWAQSAIALARGTQQVGRSVMRARALVLEVADTSESAVAGEGQAQKDRPQRPQTADRLHPTTVLGLQAMIAGVVAMGVARLLGLHHTNWTFWTSFVVIAGSAGESLRRMLLRVIGTTAGATIGVALALLMPDRVVVVAVLSTLGIMMAIFEAPISYARMVFWINVASVPAYAQLGSRELDLLRQRPLAAAVGGAVAVLVTQTVFPLRLTNRVNGMIRQYLAAVDTATSAWTAACADSSSRPAAELATARAGATYDQLRLGLEASMFETNPFPRTASPLAGQAVTLGAIDASLHRLARAVPDEAATSPRALELIGGIADQIHHRLAANDAEREPRPVGGLASLPIGDNVDNGLVWAFNDLCNSTARLAG